jgi:nitric oxide dioxygenase
VHAFKDAIEDLNSKENKQFHSFYEHYPNIETNAIRGRAELHQYKKK